MVLIPPGKFQMGSPSREEARRSDEQRHEVEITRPFYLGKYEVTQEQYEALTGENPSEIHGRRLPVEMVSWAEATAFCEKLSNLTGKKVRLPTEAEWEYACRAGTVTPFHFGTELNGTQANCDGNHPYGAQEIGPCKKGTCEVGSYSPNSWGLYDMHGNVWEWCADWYKKPYALKHKKDPLHDNNGFGRMLLGLLGGNGRVLRGGSWCDQSRYCRAASRNGNAPTKRGENCGFRVAFHLD
jgi:formylglycine-generating enzyme required for sulfatase activity